MTPIEIVNLCDDNVDLRPVHASHPFRRQCTHLRSSFVDSCSLSSTRCPTSTTPQTGSRSCMLPWLRSAQRNLKLVLFHLAREQSRPKSVAFMSTVGESWSMRRFGSGVLQSCETIKEMTLELSSDARRDYATPSNPIASLKALRSIDKISMSRQAFHFTFTHYAYNRNVCRSATNQEATANYLGGIA